MIIDSNFKPLWWLNNCHAQTLYPSLTHRVKAPIDRRERIELPDGDFIDLAWSVNGLPPDSPLIVLLHGLGGSVRSCYVAGLLSALNQAGYRGVLMHFRGASEEPNRLPRVYHSGDTDDLHYVMERLNQREPATAKAVIGVSLGGNVLLKWLGERRNHPAIQAAIAVSVPFQLDRVVEQLNRGFSRLYQAYLLRSLRPVFMRKLPLIQSCIPLSQRTLLSLKTLRDFDDNITAPLHGFANAEDYYRKASSRPYLSQISIPTLIIHALDDPFMTPQVLPQKEELSAHTLLELSEHGGHVGFITASDSNRSHPVYWLPKRIPAFLRQYL
ncbi:MAG: hydrolase [Legionellaceae bacterium]|nr:hydrolase [Legionellaceae bacterium]